jgi:RNA polymerase sigma-70 factor (ECF subfamily)
MDMVLVPDQVVAHRLMLMRVARQLLRNDAWAEDAVSETLMAALEKPDGYTGRASVKVWLVGILKHKAVDQIRRHTRECQATFSSDAGSDCGDLHDAEQGDAFEVPADWGDPQDCLCRRQFMLDLDRCLKILPPLHARAVMLRDCMEEETKVICGELGVTSNHLFVILHRARGHLRESMQEHRFPDFGSLSPHASVRAFSSPGTFA